MSQTYFDFIMLVEPALVWTSGLAITIFLTKNIIKRRTYPLVLLEIGAIVALILFSLYLIGHIEYYSIFRFDGSDQSIELHEAKSLSATAIMFQQVFLTMLLGNVILYAILKYIYRNKTKTNRTINLNILYYFMKKA